MADLAYMAVKSFAIPLLFFRIFILYLLSRLSVCGAPSSGSRTYPIFKSIFVDILPGPNFELLLAYSGKRFPAKLLETLR
jgi:hypothetical protein